MSLARSRLVYRIAGVALGMVMAYLVFYVVPQSLVLFGPFIGLASAPAGALVLARTQELVIPALAVGALYPLASKTKYEGAMAVVLGAFVIAFFFFALGGGSVAASSVQTSSTGLQVDVTTSISFVPLLYLFLLPVLVFMAKGAYMAYLAMTGRSSPAQGPQAVPPQATG